MMVKSNTNDKPVNWWVYIVYESPAVDPFYCKVGISNRPMVRLQELQQGNPRPLRTPSYSRKPNGEFGLRCDSKTEAMVLERRVHERLKEMGCGLMSDFDYVRMDAFEREWFSGIHPDRLEELIVEEYSHIMR